MRTQERDHHTEVAEKPSGGIRSRLNALFLGVGRYSREVFDTNQEKPPKEVLSLNSRNLIAWSAILRELAIAFRSEVTAVLKSRSRKEAEVLRSILNFAPGSVKDALTLYPLLRRAASEELSSDDIRPYRSALKNVADLVSSDALDSTVKIGCLAFIPPLWVFATRLKNLKVEFIAVSELPKAAAQMKDQFEQLYPVVYDFCSEFPQPSAQLRGEVDLLRQEINEQIKLGITRIPRDSTYGEETAKIIWSVLAGFVDKLFSEQEMEFKMLRYFLKHFGIKRFELGEMPEGIHQAIPSFLRALDINSKFKQGDEEVGIVELIQREIPPAFVMELGMEFVSPKASVVLNHLKTILRGLPWLLPESGSEFLAEYSREAEAFGATIAYDAALLN